ncbi:hypothetical protein TRFO_20705 [Tritrichomonas foetus]|uniref:Uncharacterized protein n=1 Tax=Tritrichomonas foetus TaxID=1144522 RepID=A0A1J4KJX4_9EUKA|nr:hypothetical protein TRFO_20705 [Tritrichomonas foetus]|eukprot:OHT10148.1 hypothetical protein TRFO_20705 [Tritrichomonas foetus]
MNPPQYKNISFSNHPNLQNFHCLDWGPGGFLAAAFENYVTIYDSSLNFFRSFNLHKSNISCVRFSPVSVERSIPNSFQSFIAVGDETGNCLVYDIYNGVRHAGFSPEKLPIIPIIDIQWNISNPSMLFILTAAPSLLCVNCGSTSRRHYSCVESWAPIGQSIQSFNMSFNFSVPLSTRFQYITVDQFHLNQLLVASSSGNYYSLIKIQNGRNQPFVTQLLQFNGLPADQKILTVEYFPHNINRITIVMTHSIYVYDLAAKTASLIYNNDLALISPMTNVFLPSIADRFWISVNDGTIACFSVEGENYIRHSYVLVPQFHQMAHFIVDPFNFNRLAICTADGKIAVFTSINRKIICSAYRPSFNDHIEAINTNNKDKYSFVSNQGYVGVFDTEKGYSLRFKIELPENLHSKGEPLFDSIAFAGNKIAVGGSRLFVIDLYERKISIMNKHLSPSKMNSTGSLIAYIPFPNTLDILYPSTPKTSLAFAGAIVSFASRMADPSEWALVVRGNGCVIVDISQKPKMIVQFPFPDEPVTCMLFIGSCVYIGTRIGELYRVSIETKKSTVLNISGSMIRTMKCYENYIFVSDNDYNSYLIDINEYKVIKSPKWKIQEIHFLSNNVAVAMTSKTTLVLINIPSFEIIISPGNAKSDAIQRFSVCNSVDELEKIALEVGDLDFVQFIRVFQRKGELPLPALYTQNHNEFIEKEKVTRFIERLTQPQNLIDFMILTKQNQYAAKLLLKNGGENEMLLAYACLSPNLEAAMEITKGNCSKKHVQNVARLLCLSDDKNAAIEWLTLNEDWNAALYFLKMLFDDEVATSSILAWLNIKTILQLSPLIMSFVGDYHAALTVLYRSGSVAKAFALLCYLREKGIEIKKSSFEDYSNEDIEDLKEKIQAKWDSYGQ